jgi:hypothetical protein
MDHADEPHHPAGRWVDEVVDGRLQSAAAYPRLMYLLLAHAVLSGIR